MAGVSSKSRDLLLRAGAAQVLEGGLAILQSGLSVTDLASRAGLSEKTFFKTFGSKERYVDALAASLVGAARPDVQNVDHLIEDALVSSRGDIRRTVRAVCDSCFQEVGHAAATRAGIAVLALASGHKEAMGSLKHAYGVYDSIGTRAYDAVIARWGASLRAPFSAQLVAVTLTAIVQGLVLRSLADPDAVPDDLFGNVVIALLSSVIDANHGHEHIDDEAAPLAAEVMRVYKASQVDCLPDDPRKDIIDAARLELGGTRILSKYT